MDFNIVAMDYSTNMVYMFPISVPDNFENLEAIEQMADAKLRSMDPPARLKDCSWMSNLDETKLIVEHKIDPAGYHVVPPPSEEEIKKKYIEVYGEEEYNKYYGK